MDIESFVDSATTMNDGLISVSVGGMTFVLLIWSAFYGLKDDWNLKGFKYPLWLIVPFTLFLSSYIALQLFFYSALTGFRWEVMKGRWVDEAGKEVQIADVSQHFLDQYANDIQFATALSLLSVIAAIVLVSIWFIFNILAFRRA